MSDWDDVRSIERIARRLRVPESPDPSFEKRLQERLEASVANGEAPAHRRHAASGADRKRLTTRPVGIRRLGLSWTFAMAAAAVLGVLVAASTAALFRGADRPLPTLPGVRARSAESARLVHFTVAVPSAGRVSVVGDFNGWNVDATPLRSGASAGLWTATISLAPGTYQYAFVIDGSVWQADPGALVTWIDEFGAPSSLLTVREERT